MRGPTPMRPILEVETPTNTTRSAAVSFGRAVGAVDGIPSNLAAAASPWSVIRLRQPPRLVLRLIDPTAGIVRFAGHAITDFAGEPLRNRAGGRNVFQDPFARCSTRA